MVAAVGYVSDVGKNGTKDKGSEQEGNQESFGSFKDVGGEGTGAEGVPGAHARKEKKEGHEEGAEKDGEACDGFGGGESDVVKLSPCVEGLGRVVWNQEKDVHPAEVIDEMLTHGLYFLSGLLFILTIQSAYL